MYLCHNCIVSDETPTLRQSQMCNLEVGSAVQRGDPPRYGTIKEFLKSSVNGEKTARVEWVNTVYYVYNVEFVTVTVH